MVSLSPQEPPLEPVRILGCVCSRGGNDAAPPCVGGRVAEASCCWR
jgi:hypothetical protein